MVRSKKAVEDEGYIYIYICTCICVLGLSFNVRW